MFAFLRGTLGGAWEGVKVSALTLRLDKHMAVKGFVLAGSIFTGWP